MIMRSWIFEKFLQNSTAITVTDSKTFVIKMFTMHLIRLLLEWIVFLKHYHSNCLEVGKPYTC